MIVSHRAAQRRALFVLALTLAIGGTGFVTQAWGAGAFAIGKCGAYGKAYDYAGEGAARVAALKQCKGECSIITMKHACGACDRHDQSLRSPRLRGTLADFGFAQRNNPRMLQV